MATHRLDAGPDTVHWGFFDAALKPLRRPIVNISRGLPGRSFPRVGADDALIGTFIYLDPTVLIFMDYSCCIEGNVPVFV
jgi:hypothetical protein